MNRYKYSILILLAGICTALNAQYSRLELTINSIKPGEGIVRVAICDNSDQFPDKPSLHYNIPKKDIKDNTIRIIIPGLKPGNYAITLLDDNNSNGKMDTGMFGIPKEGFGFSNNVRPTRKQPDFEKCAFQVREGPIYLEINMQYFGKGS